MIEVLFSSDYTFMSATFGSRSKYLRISHTDVMSDLSYAKKTFGWLAKTYNICISLDYVENWYELYKEADFLLETFEHLPIMIGDNVLFDTRYRIDVDADDYDIVNGNYVKNMFLTKKYHEMNSNKIINK